MPDQKQQTKVRNDSLTSKNKIDVNILNIDTCKGDSGGPLMYFSPVRQRFELVGIISFGTGCGDADHAGVYTRVSSYLDWIESIISKQRETI